MNFQFNDYAITLIVSGIATLLLSFFIFQKRVPVVRWFAVMMMCIATWAVTYGFELASSTLSQMLFWINLEYIGLSLLPAVWIVFMIRFVGKSEWLTGRNMFLFFKIPVMTLLLVWTNSWHHLHYQAVSVDRSGPFPLLAITPGIWYIINTVYFYGLLIFGGYLLIRRFRNADAIFKKQNRIILIGACIPWTVNILYLAGVRPHAHIDLTPYAFILTSTIIGIGLLKFRLFDVVPVAREKLIDGMSDGMLVLDVSGYVVDLNPAMKKFLPTFVDNPIGKSLKDILPLERKLHNIVTNRREERIELIVKNGKSRFFEVAVSTLFEKDTIYSGTLLRFWDITEYKRTEQTLKEQSAELNKINKLKDRILSIISHDLRTPLADLMSTLSLIEQGGISEHEFRKYTHVLTGHVKHTSTLLENLLVWSSSQLKGDEVKQDVFDLKALIIDSMKLFEQQVQEKYIVLENKVIYSVLLSADFDMVGFMLRNLLSNAIKFCRKGDSIAIGVMAGEGPRVTVYVRDTGVGLSKEVRENIFGDKMISKPGTNQEKGTGLGLKICKEFVEKNGGTLWVETVEGHGSTFFFTLKKALVESMKVPSVEKKQSSDRAK